MKLEIFKIELMILLKNKLVILLNELVILFIK